MQRNSYLTLFLTFFKIGATTFGGGYAMLPIIQREVVEKHHWLENEEFVDVLAVAQSSPGAVAINSAVFIGCRLYGLPGAVVALLGSVLPSFLIILSVAAFFTRFMEHPAVHAAFLGIRPAVAALILAAVIKLGLPVIRDRRRLPHMIIFLILSVVIGIHPVLIILLGLAYGLLRGPKTKKERENGPL